MAYEIFPYRPMLETPGRDEFRTLTAQFGDGYRQEAGEGINNIKQSWNLTFKGTVEQMMPIRAFIRARKGFEPFYWTPKGDSQRLFTCKDSSFVNNTENARATGVWTLSLVFEEFFAPL